MLRKPGGQLLNGLEIAMWADHLGNPLKGVYLLWARFLSSLWIFYRVMTSSAFTSYSRGHMVEAEVHQSSLAQYTYELAMALSIFPVYIPFPLLPTLRNVSIPCIFTTGLRPKHLFDRRRLSRSRWMGGEE